MNSFFDAEAPSYDLSFTYSPIGQLQRTQVWDYLEKVLPELHGIEILELNCGTGEDAVHLSNKGYQILATDISKNMLEVAKTKASKADGGKNISFQSLDLSNISYLNGKKFDMVLSNFGGLNCIDAKALNKIFIEVANLLKSNGRFIAVIMPRFCLWEFVYYSIKLNGSKALRRIRNKTTVQLENDSLPVWYYNPGMVKKCIRSKFKIRQYQPIGIAIPPSYLNAAFEKRKALLSALEKMERKLNRFKWLSNLSDHFLIDLQLK